MAAAEPGSFARGEGADSGDITEEIEIAVQRRVSCPSDFDTPMTGVEMSLDAARKVRALLQFQDIYTPRHFA